MDNHEFWENGQPLNGIIAVLIGVIDQDLNQLGTGGRRAATGGQVPPYIEQDN